MTSRFFRRAISWDDYRAAIDLVPPPHVDAPEAEYNIAPGRFAPILRRAPEGEYAPRHAIQVAPAFWGLVPVWWKQPLSEKKFATFNARAADIESSNTFSGAFRQGRCLIPRLGLLRMEQRHALRLRAHIRRLVLLRRPVEPRDDRRLRVRHLRHHHLRAPTSPSPASPTQCP
jgi:putative SOS response-associated peptidase YedK